MLNYCDCRPFKKVADTHCSSCGLEYANCRCGSIKIEKQLRKIKAKSANKAVAAALGAKTGGLSN